MNITNSTAAVQEVQLLIPVENIQIHAMKNTKVKNALGCI